MSFDKINALDYAIRLKVFIYEDTSAYLSAVGSNNIW